VTQRSSTDRRRRSNTEYPAERICQSALMPAKLITLAHFSVSSAMSLPKSAAVPDIAQQAQVFELPLDHGSPCQALTSKPGRKSATVGTSGSASSRFVVVTASGRSLPALMSPFSSLEVSPRGVGYFCAFEPRSRPGTSAGESGLSSFIIRFTRRARPALSTAAHQAARAAQPHFHRWL
jgi:hypothetical protein